MNTSIKLKSIKSDSGRDTLLTVAEVAALLQVSRKTIYNWAYRNLIPRIKFGQGLLRFRREDIEAWVASKSLLA